MTTIADIRKLLASEFDAACTAFRKSPNGANWGALKRAMLHHQQAWQLRETSFDKEFAESLGKVPMGEWGRKVVEYKWPNDSYNSIVNADK